MRPLLTSLFMTVSVTFSFSQALVPFFSEGKWGFMDTLGKEVIAPQYDQTSFFSEDRAAVVTENGVGYINEKGEMVIAEDYESGLDFHNGVVSVFAEEDWMVIDKNGEPLFEGYFAAPLKFNDGLARIKQEAGLFSKYGFINQKGDTVIGMQFELASDFSEGLCMASTNGEKYGFINTKGEWVIPEQYEMGILTKINGAYDFSDKDFSGGFAAVQIGEKVGAIDQSGALQIEASFEAIGHFHDGLAPAKFEGKYGYIDTKGKWVIKPAFVQAERFNEGVAAVAQGELFEYQWGLIDKNGKLLFEPYIVASIDFTSPLIFHDGYLVCLIDKNVFGYVDRNGKVIWKLTY